MSVIATSGRSLAVALLCLLLAGCFVSEQPMFPLATAIPALGVGGHYGYYQRDAKGDFQRQQSFEVRHRNDGAYDVINSSGEVSPASLHPIANGTLVLQSKSERDNPPYLYLIMQVVDGEAFIYIPDCDKLDKDKLANFGVEKRDTHKCIIDRVADPTGLFAAVNLGNSGMKIVRDLP